MVQIGHIDNLWGGNEIRMKRYANKLIPFLKPKGMCLDMDKPNPKMEYIKSKMGFSVSYITGYDFNFDTIQLHQKYDTIFILEVLEHLQNPLFFMSQAKDCLTDNGSIYLTMPVNNPVFKMDTHYFEIPKKHFERWILEPLDLKIVRSKRVIFIHTLFPFGIRPMIRILKGKQSFKSLIKLMFHVKYMFYEIKKVSV